MAFLLQHTRLGFCWLDLIALAVLVVVIGVFIYQHRKLKKQDIVPMYSVFPEYQKEAEEAEKAKA